jgi:subtilisin-like proprotein convertase family protein
VPPQQRGEPIVVPDLGTVASVEISVDINHTWLADLSVALNKDGQLSTWMFRNIKQSGSLISCSGDDMTALLSEDADLSIQSQACINANLPAVNGTFFPEEPLTNFDGASIAGTWNLVVDDVAGGDFGQVNQWCIYITPA